MQYYSTIVHRQSGPLPGKLIQSVKLQSVCRSSTVCYHSNTIKHVTALANTHILLLPNSIYLLQLINILCSLLYLISQLNLDERKKLVGFRGSNSHYQFKIMYQ